MTTTVVPTSAKSHMNAASRLADAGSRPTVGCRVLGLGLVRRVVGRRAAGWRGSRCGRCRSAGSGSSAAARPCRSTPSTSRNGCRPVGAGRLVAVLAARHEPRPDDLLVVVDRPHSLAGTVVDDPSARAGVRPAAAERRRRRTRPTTAGSPIGVHRRRRGGGGVRTTSDSSSGQMPSADRALAADDAVDEQVPFGLVLHRRQRGSGRRSRRRRHRRSSRGRPAPAGGRRHRRRSSRAEPTTLRWCIRRRPARIRPARWVRLRSGRDCLRGRASPLQRQPVRQQPVQSCQPVRPAPRWERCPSWLRRRSRSASATNRIGRSSPRRVWPRRAPRRRRSPARCGGDGRSAATRRRRRARSAPTRCRGRSSRAPRLANARAISGAPQRRRPVPGPGRWRSS